MIIVDYSNFDINNYSFFNVYEIVLGKNVRQQLKYSCHLQVLSYSSLLAPMLRSKVQPAPPALNICGKHNERIYSEIEH